MREKNYLKMSNDDEKRKATIKQLAVILNYKPQIEHQHIHYGGKEQQNQVEESDADKNKRQKLIATNTVIRTENKEGQTIVDLLDLYQYIDKRFVGDITFKYEWYALRRFLEKMNLLRECDNEQFAAQMNHVEWFAHAKKTCEANEMNTYNFLNDTKPSQWCDKEIPIGSKATSKGVGNIYKVYENLMLYKEEIMGK